MLDVRKLRVLRELSERGTIAATAEALSFTPSAISQQLSALERETGVELLAREGRRLTLTEPARRLVARTDEVLAALEAAEADLEASVGEVRGTIALAAFPTAAATLVPPVVAALRDEHPALAIRVEELEPQDSLPALRLGEIDVALAHDYDTIPRQAEPAFAEHPLLADPLRIALPAGHRLARGRNGDGTVDLADLAGERWIAGRPGTHCGTVVTTAARAAGFEPDVVAHGSEFATMLALVSAGLGVALVPGLATVAGGLPGVALLEPRPALNRHIYAAVRPGSGRRAAVAAVLAALTARAAELS
jgi:DNA-binding transcriptional LysR family regulator